MNKELQIFYGYDQVQVSGKLDLDYIFETDQIKYQ